MFPNKTIVGYELIIFYKYFVSWFVPAVIIFGSFGTIISIIVLLFRRTTQPEIRCWFLALSANDLFGLVFGLSTLYLSKLNFIMTNPLWDLDLKSSQFFVCYFNSNCIFFSLLLSSWLQTGISGLRAVSTSQPLKLRTKITTSTARLYLVLLIGCALIISLLLINITMEYTEVRLFNRSQGYRCRLKRNFTDMFYFFSLIVRVVIPILLLFLSSIMIWKSLQKHQNEKRHSYLLGNSEVTTLKVSSSPRERSMPHPNSYHRNISCMLLWMNLAFLLANLPYEIFKIIYKNYDLTLIQTKSEMHLYILSRILDKFFNILVYLNQSTNWLFYFMLGKKFRKDLMILFGCQRFRWTRGNANSKNANNIEYSSTHSLRCNRNILYKQTTLEKFCSYNRHLETSQDKISVMNVSEIQMNTK